MDEKGDGLLDKLPMPIARALARARGEGPAQVASAIDDAALFLGCVAVAALSRVDDGRPPSAVDEFLVHPSPERARRAVDHALVVLAPEDRLAAWLRTVALPAGPCSLADLEVALSPFAAPDAPGLVARLGRWTVRLSGPTTGLSSSGAEVSLLLGSRRVLLSPLLVYDPVEDQVSFACARQGVREDGERSGEIRLRAAAVPVSLDASSVCGPSKGSSSGSGDGESGGGPADVEEAGLVLGCFRIVRRISSGGQGVVHEAWQEPPGRRVALKTLSTEAMRSDDAHRRIAEEGAALARVEHEHVVPVYAAGELAGSPYIAMKYVEGIDLRLVLQSLGGRPRKVREDEWRRACHLPERSWPTGRRLHVTLVVELGRDVASALAACHGRGVVHRDVKPANLMVDRDGRVLLTDFGLARTEDTRSLTAMGSLVGTLAYVPPESVQPAGRCRRDHRVDVYGLGATLYELLTLRRPYAVAEGSPAQLIQAILTTEPTAMRALAPWVHRDLETIVMKAIEKEPHRRYGTAADMAEDLERFLAGRPILARRATLLVRAVKWVRRRPARAAALLGILVLALVAGGLALRTKLLERRAAEDGRREAEREEVERRRRRVEDSLRLAKGADAISIGRDPSRFLNPLLLHAGPDTTVRVVRDLDLVTESLRAERRKVYRAAGPIQGMEEDLDALDRGEPGGAAITEAARRLEAGGVTASVRVASAERALYGGYESYPGLLCEALGSMGDPAVSVPALGRYLAAVECDSFAVPAGRALNELAGLGFDAEIRSHLRSAGRRFGRSGDFHRRVIQVCPVPGVATPEAGWWAPEPPPWPVHGEIRAATGAILLDWAFTESWAVRRLPQDGVRGGWPADGAGPLDAGRLLERGDRRFYEKNDLEGAEADYAEALGQSPGDRLLLLLLAKRGMARRLLGRYREAEADFLEVLRLQPEWVSQHANLAVVYTESRQIERALEEATRAEELVRTRIGLVDGPFGEGVLQDSSSAGPLSYRAMAHLVAGNVEEAHADAQASVRASPPGRGSEPCQVLGAALLAGGDPRGSLEHRRRAVELDPGYILGFNGLGVTLHVLGQEAEAIAALSESIRLDPAFPTAWLNRGIVRLSRGELGPALDDLSTSILCAPRLPHPWLARGLVRLRMGRREEARSDLERFLALAPDHPRAAEVQALLPPAATPR